MSLLLPAALVLLQAGEPEGIDRGVVAKLRALASLGVPVMGRPVSGRDLNCVQVPNKLVAEVVKPT